MIFSSTTKLVFLVECKIYGKLTFIPCIVKIMPDPGDTASPYSLTV